MIRYLINLKRNKNETEKLFMKKIHYMVIITLVVLLSSCAIPKKDTSISIRTQPIKDSEEFEDMGKYLYKPPKIYRTWINSRVTDDNQVVSAHYLYWLPKQGHWNVPIRNQNQRGANILSPAIR